MPEKQNNNTCSSTIPQTGGCTKSTIQKGGYYFPSAKSFWSLQS
jgi:hypothetical protein